MRPFRLIALAPLVLSLLLTSPVWASPEQSNSGITSPGLLALITNDDVFSTTDLTLAMDPAGTGSTKHYGPYPSTSTDSGTCGNDWANDTFDRHFTVQSGGGSITVIEQFKDGTFTTPASDSPPVNFSPGGCETSSTPAGKVNDGITGSLHGYFIIPLPANEVQTSTSPFCNATLGTDANCDTATFINTHFSPACYPSAMCTVTTFFFHYAAGDQSLIDHEWKNASSDRGGNSGDIRSANLP